jgi:hypothetical protein
MSHVRNDVRTAVDYPAAVLLEGKLLSCRMLDVSPNGARLFVPDVPPVIDRITLLLSAMGARREGFVTWKDGCHIGVAFDRP